MFSDRDKIWVQRLLLVFSAIVAGYIGGQFSSFSHSNSSPERLTCRELQIVDASGKPLISMVSGKTGPKIKLIGKDGVQTLSLEVIDAIASVDNRMAKIAFGHSELEGNQISLCAARDKSADMFMGQHDSYGAISMSAAPFGAYPSSDFRVGYLSGPHLQCLANGNQVQVEIGQGSSFINAGKIGQRLPYLQVKDSERNSLIDLIERNEKQSK